MKLTSSWACALGALLTLLVVFVPGSADAKGKKKKFCSGNACKAVQVAVDRNKGADVRNDDSRRVVVVTLWFGNFFGGGACGVGSTISLLPGKEKHVAIPEHQNFLCSWEAEYQKE